MTAKIEDFSGSKLAYIYRDLLLVYKRDDNPKIPFPGLWDFPGGGREGDESPETCVLRELEEEFSITLSMSRLVYKKQVSSHTGKSNSYFFVALGNRKELDRISFGDEGQFWELMPIEKYLSHPQSIPALVNRLLDYLKAKHLKGSL